MAIYNRLVVEQNAAYNAYIEHDETAILSISPELFFKEHQGQLTTRPMKGTTNRGLTLEQDREQAAWLAQDAKNRAENMMIVDLLRNDMNRISQTGSERVERSLQCRAILYSLADDLYHQKPAAGGNRTGRAFQSALSLRIHHRRT